MNVVGFTAVELHHSAAATRSIFEHELGTLALAGTATRYGQGSA
jgi:hypothetical protein